MVELLYVIVTMQITNAAVTLYLHRSQAHRSVVFHQAVEHFFRFWLWLTTGMITAQWVAIHRKHHQNVDRRGDPHSPKVYGKWKVFLGGVYYYYQAAKDPEIVLKYGQGTPKDWIEKNLYMRHPFAGVVGMAVVDVLLFGWTGLLVWLAQIVWIPFWAAGVINGLGHWIGYRNFDTKDTSTNLWPWAVWIAGEELHNNHHHDAASPKFSKRWFEIDIGWGWIKLLKWAKLAKLRTELVDESAIRKA